MFHYRYAASGELSSTNYSISALRQPTSSTQIYLLMYLKLVMCFKFDEPWWTCWLDVFLISLLLYAVTNTFHFEKLRVVQNPYSQNKILPGLFLWYISTLHPYLELVHKFSSTLNWWCCPYPGLCPSIVLLDFLCMMRAQVGKWCVGAQTTHPSVQG